MTRAHDITAAIADWQSSLEDPTAVECSAQVLTRYARSTTPHTTTPAAVLYPRNTVEVQRICSIANTHAVPLYPIARGKNWGYGDACALSDNAVIVDCSRMNRILEINPTMGYAVIEPGVSQGQLYKAVQSEAPAFWMDATGAGPDASIVGNVLERGFGHTPYGDHVQTSAGLEVVLANGEVLETGFHHGRPAKAAHLYPYGVGPMLDGLFSQSNLGIVTRLTVWLYPKPEAFAFFYIQVQEESNLAPLLDALRKLRMQSILPSAIHLGNDLRILSSHAPYPHDHAPPGTPLNSTQREAMRKEFGVGCWNVSGSLTGTNATVREGKRQLRNAVRGLGTVVFVDDAKLALGKRVAGWTQATAWGKRLGKQLAALEPNYGLLKGIPTHAPLQGTTWGLRETPKNCTDPLNHEAGFIWLSPVLPAEGEATRHLLEILDPIFTSHGFDMLVSFTLINPRAMVGVINMVFERSDTDQCQAAAACYEAAMKACMEAGYPPYRSSTLGMPLLSQDKDTFWDTTQTIKKALDPNEILAPGRYIPPLD